MAVERLLLFASRPSGSVGGLEPQLGKIVLPHGVPSARRLEVVDPGAEQAYRTLPRGRLVEQGDRPCGNLVRVARGLGGVAPGDGREVAVSHLDGHGARDETLAAEPLGVLTGHARDLLAD